MKKIIFIALSLILLSACGKKTDLGYDNTPVQEKTCLDKAKLASDCKP